MVTRIYHKGGMRVISYDTYAKYAQKYGIGLKSGGKPKPMQLLARQIQPYEKARLKLKGPYFY